MYCTCAFSQYLCLEGKKWIELGSFPALIFSIRINEMSETSTLPISPNISFFNLIFGAKNQICFFFLLAIFNYFDHFERILKMHFITLHSLGYKGPPNMAPGTCVSVAIMWGLLQKRFLGRGKSQNVQTSNIMCVCVQREIKRKLVFDWAEGVVPHSPEDVLQSILIPAHCLKSLIFI